MVNQIPEFSIRYLIRIKVNLIRTPITPAIP